ncbi:MAG: type I 3-dehydroquinate dehydratase, partial [Thermoplasmata archaeon]
MTSSAPLIIVSLPGRSISELRRQALLAHAAGADLAEVRVDRLTPEERSRLPELFPAPLPLIATLRSRAEGGEGVDAPDERARQLLAAANLPFRWIDLEEARDSALEGRLPPSSSLGRILSSHLPEGTAVTEALERLHRSAPAGCVRKVVVWATVGSLLHDVLPRLEPRAATSIVVLTTGPSGGLLRAWSRRLGFPFVYASPPGADARAPVDAVEPSQVPVDRLRPFFQGGDEAPIFAVTGHPVAHSQSPYLHSRWMRARRQTGLYISLDISEETEFLDALAPLADRGFRGLNVTHPWKAVGLNAASRAAPGAARCGAANCLTFRDGEVEAENTDLVAILRRLEEFRTRGSWDGR